MSKYKTDRVNMLGYFVLLMHGTSQNIEVIDDVDIRKCLYLFFCRQRGSQRIDNVSCQIGATYLAFTMFGFTV